MRYKAEIVHQHEIFRNWFYKKMIVCAEFISRGFRSALHTQDTKETHASKMGGKNFRMDYGNLKKNLFRIIVKPHLSIDSRFHARH